MVECPWHTVSLLDSLALLEIIKGRKAKGGGEAAQIMYSQRVSAKLCSLTNKPNRLHRYFEHVHTNHPASSLRA